MDSLKICETGYNLWPPCQDQRKRKVPSRPSEKASLRRNWDFLGEAKATCNWQVGRAQAHPGPPLETPLDGGTTTHITQSVVEVGEYEKRDKLLEILRSQTFDRTLVYVERKRNADFLASFLSQEGFPTTSIHGDRFQQEREEALRDFRSGRAPVLVATSVAARCLDISEVKHAVNYDLPQSIEEYVHRIGRTGRIGNKGQATAFFQKDKDINLARSLVKVLGDAEQDVPEFLEQAAKEATGTHYGPQGGQFTSKDIRSRGGGTFGGGGGRGGRGWVETSEGFGGRFCDSEVGGGGGGQWHGRRRRRQRGLGLASPLAMPPVFQDISFCYRTSII